MLVSNLGFAQSTPTWTQLSLSTCRVDEFLAANPKHDGRGVVIAVLDTGVDPSIPGLTRTPGGEVKVIDVQDFTGQGDIELHRVRLDPEKGTLVDYDDDGSPIHYALASLPLPEGSTSEERRFWMGTLDESKFINSDVPDLNDNGTTDDKFPVCVTALSGDGDDQALCLVDTNMNRSFADEKPLKNYKLNYDTFNLFRDKPEKQIVPVTFAVNIFLRQSKVVVCYDDGAHGTHVAGIAAGCRINNQDGFNGVAPGAKLMGLKIGKNSVGGVSSTAAIKRALEYAARYAREHDVQVVCNLSFGVESVLEGNSGIDQAINKILRKNPHLIFCTSAGNEGPGVSSVGTPSAATEAICVAALLAPDSARDAMAIDIDRPVLTTFSARGGELDKPDLAVPGWCTSTVPRWVKDADYWPGTSMASPYAAGLCALLISDAQARHPGVKIRAWDVRRALCLTASPVADATELGIGYGMPDLPAAADLLNQLVSTAQNDPLVGYEISTPCPHTHEGKARSAYWRGTYFPTDKPQVFTISPLFAPGVDASAKTSFTRQFELRSTVGWCRLTQQQIYLRSEQEARVAVEYLADQLAAPGLYVGAVEALADGRVAFRLLNTIVVPYRFTAEGNFMRSFKDQVAKGWKSQRYFLAVPPGASAMNLTCEAPEGKDSKVRMNYIYDPTGKELRDRAARLNTDTGRRKVERNFTDELIPGVWEVDIYANKPDKQWPYHFTVRFFGLHADQPEINSWDEGAGELTVTNLFEQPLPTTADGKLEGFRMYKEDNFKGLKDELTDTVQLDERFKAVRVDLEMEPEAYATTTDIGLSIEDASGEALAFGAFSNRTCTVTAKHPSPGETAALKVVIRGGFAVEDDKRETPITVKIDYLLADPLSIEVTRGDSSNMLFIPNVPMTMEYALESELPEAPDGTYPVGYLRFRERGSNDVALRVPIDITE
ncbi:MAG: S8 family serine peptidase [Phycisphaerae bacterium]|nr:S8 family serine peptidase [Phycisphaerae bacterium]